MNPFVFDIETGPRPDAEQWIPLIEPPANYKDPEKIAAYVAERKAKALEQAALSAETARVLCVGILPHDKSPVFVGNDDEALLLRATWEELEKRAAADVFVTFNGAKFDWPMLVRRSYLLGVPVPSWMPRDGRWRPRQHVDIMEWWQCGDRQESISLDRLARLCGLPGKTDSGARFHVTWAENRDAALAYLRHDLELTRDLYLRIAGNLEVEPASETPVVPPTAAELLDEIKSVLTQRWPGASPEDKAGRQDAISAAFGADWKSVKTMPADALRGGLAQLRARLAATEPDAIPMSSSAAPAPPAPQPATSVPPKSEPRMEVQKQAAAAPASAGEPGVAEALAAELRRVLGTPENAEKAIAWMVRNKWLTEQLSKSVEPFLHVPQVKAEKALGAPDRFLTAIGATKGGGK